MCAHLAAQTKLKLNCWAGYEMRTKYEQGKEMYWFTFAPLIFNLAEFRNSLISFYGINRQQDQVKCMVTGEVVAGSLVYTESRRVGGIDRIKKERAKLQQNKK